MTNTVHRGPADTAAVTPVLFSHEVTEESVPRQAASERADLVQFSADTEVSSRPATKTT